MWPLVKRRTREIRVCGRAAGHLVDFVERCSGNPAQASNRIAGDEFPARRVRMGDIRRAGFAEATFRCQGSIKIQIERPHTNVILLTKHSDADVGSPRRRFIHEARVQVELRSGQSVHLKRVLKVDAGLSLWIRFARTST